MFSYVTDIFSTLKTLKETQVSVILDDLRAAITHQMIGPRRRSQVNTDPKTLIESKSPWFANRFKHQSGYILFYKTIYHLSFNKDGPVIQECTLLQTPKDETEWLTIRNLFPKEDAPVKWTIDKELAQITALIEPINAGFPSFNHRLLRPYFTNPSEDNLFIEFSDLYLKSIEKDTEVNPSTLLNAEHYPTLIRSVETKVGYFSNVTTSYTYELYGYSNHQWKKTSLGDDIIKTLDIDFTAENNLLRYDPQYAKLYQQILESNAHQPLSTLPAQITQIHQIISALYYSKQVFSNLEGSILNVGLQYFYGAIHEQAQQAIQRLTYDHMELKERFADELLELSFLIERFHDYSKPDILPKEPSTTPWAYQLGFATGYAARHLHAEEGRLNVKVLSQLSANFPKYIDELTTFINKQTATVTQHAPNIDPKQLQALQKEATILLNTLKSNPKAQLNAFQIINYIHLIRQVIVLLSTTVTQLGHLNTAYQELIRTYLEILKYQFCPRLFALTDKIEIEFLLEPGCVSQPVMNKVNEAFTFITGYIRNLADFSLLGEELLVLEDARFLRQRRSNIQTLENESSIKNKKFEIAITCAQQYFELLDNPTQLDELGQDLYASFAPHLKKIYPDAHKQFSKSSAPNFTREELLYIKQQLEAYLQKSTNTEILRILQCKAILESIDRTTQVQLFPYKERNGCDIQLLPLRIEQPLNSLNLQTSTPILIQTHDQNYYLWGNTDGTKWAFTPIEGQLLDRRIITKFSSTIPVNRSNNNQPSYHLKYNEEYQSFYTHIAKAAHTHFKSVCDDDEAELFSNQKRLAELLVSPIDTINTLLPEPVRLTGSVSLQKINSRRVPELARNKYRITIKNTQVLTADEALSLYFLYDNKINNIQKIQTILDAFITTIHTHFKEKTHIKFEAEDVVVQKKCKILYSYLQAYLVHLPNFAEFDQALTHALSPKSYSSRAYPTLETFNSMINSGVLSEIKKSLGQWENRRETFYKQAGVKIKEEGKQSLTPLQAKVIADARDGFVFKKTNLSNTIQIIRNAINAWIPSFNLAIRTQLDENKSGFYQENKTTDSSSTLFLKRLMNTLTHLEYMAHGLETLQTVEDDQNHSKRDQNVELIKSLYAAHAQPIQALVPALYNDTYLSTNAKHLYQQGLHIAQQLSRLINPYTVDVDTIQALDQRIQYRGLWYTLNASYLLPDNLLSITGEQCWDLGHDISLQCLSAPNTKLTKPETKRLTLIQKGNDFYIYGQGTKGSWQLNPVLEADKAIILELNINFTKTLLTYEEQYSPLYRLIVQKGYHVTGLNHSQMAAKKATINIEYLIQHANSYPRLLLSAWMIYCLNNELRAKISTLTKTMHHVVHEHLEDIQHVYLTPFLVKADRLEDQFGFNPGTFTTPLKNVCDQWYQGLIYPLKLDFTQKEALVCDEFSTNERIRQAEVTLDNIESMNSQSKRLKATEDHLQRTNNTLLKETIANKIVFLKRILLQQSHFCTQYRRSFAEHFFNSQLDLYAHTSTFQTIALRESYIKALHKHLVTARSVVIAEAIEQPNIDSSIQAQLTTLITGFNDKHFAQFKQLDTIMQTIEQFKTFVALSTSYDTEIKQRKNRTLDDLGTFITDHAIELDVISKTRDLTEKKQATLIEEPEQHTCFAWLLECIISILSAIGLYTRSLYQYHQLIAAEAPPKPTRYFNFFQGHAPSEAPKTYAPHVLFSP